MSHVFSNENPTHLKANWVPSIWKFEECPARFLIQNGKKALFFQPYQASKGQFSQLWPWKQLENVMSITPMSLTLSAGMPIQWAPQHRLCPKYYFTLVI